MEPDASKILYEKYFSRSSRLIEVNLKSGRKITGVFISFYFGDCDRSEPYIRRWHIVNEKHKMTLGIDHFDFLIGEYINQTDIKSIQFLDENSEMLFE